MGFLTPLSGNLLFSTIALRNPAKHKGQTSIKISVITEKGGSQGECSNRTKIWHGKTLKWKPMRLIGLDSGVYKGELKKW